MNFETEDLYTKIFCTYYKKSFWNKDVRKNVCDRASNLFTIL